MTQQTTPSADQLQGLITRINAQPDPYLRFLSGVGLILCLPQQADDPGFAFGPEPFLDDLEWKEADLEEVEFVTADGHAISFDEDQWSRLEFLSMMEDLVMLDDASLRHKALTAAAARTMAADVWVGW